MWFVAVLIVVIFVMGTLTRRALSGDGRTDLRRCPRCWYDMAAVAGMRCPECGHACTSEDALFRPKVNLLLARSMLACTVVFIAGVMWTLLPVPWTSKVPRFALRGMLWVGAPQVQAAGAGKLAMPVVALRDSRDPWERMVWHYQTNRAFEQWADHVLAGTGPVSDAELVALVPLADRVRECYVLTGSSNGSEAWMSDEFKGALADRRNVARREGAGDGDRLTRMEWALAEMQYEGGGYAHRHDWAQVPDPIIAKALVHPDAAVRMFGVSRYGRRAHAKVMEPKLALPPVRALVEAIAERDPDPQLRRQAADVLVYIDDFKADR